MAHFWIIMTGVLTYKIYFCGQYHGLILLIRVIEVHLTLSEAKLIHSIYL